MTNNNHGGKRSNAGRKPAPEQRKRPIAMRLDVEVSEYLDSVDDKTATVEAAIKGSKGYREWRKLNGKR